MAGGQRTDDRLGVFISYSREDLAFADQLEAALRLHKYDVLIDRHAISGGENWQPRLGALIRDADTVAFVLSPASAISSICQWEADEAVRLGKRILPVVCRPLGDAEPPQQLADRNYIFFYEEPKQPGSGFGTGLVRLVEALDTDVEWLREHTRLLQRASEWEAGGRDESRLLFGDSIEAAKVWAGRRPKEAPELSTLHLEYIRASEEYESRRQSEERRQLAEREKLVREAEAAQEAREAAQKREADQARRVVQRTMAGLIVSLVLGGVAAVAGWNAHLGRLEVEEKSKEVVAKSKEVEAKSLALSEANQRLSARMKLRIAPFGTKAYTVPEHWYTLATTNAASVGFIEVKDQSKWRFASTGFLIRGDVLFEPWGEELVFVTASHVVRESSRLPGRRIYFPALGEQEPTDLDRLLWISSSKDFEQAEFGGVSEGVDAAVYRLAGAPPSAVEPITRISDLETSKWPAVKFQQDANSVAGPELEKPLPLVALGASVEGFGQKDWRPDFDKFKPTLTLSLANALGIDGRLPDGKIVFTDSTTLGGSGSPIFDARDGALLAILQYGTDYSAPITGLSYAGGIPAKAVRDAIVSDAKEALALARSSLKRGDLLHAEACYTLAVSSDPASADRLMSEWASHIAAAGRNAASNKRFNSAIELFEKAIEVQPASEQTLRSDLASVHFDLAANSVGWGNEDDIRNHLEAALKLDPTKKEPANKLWFDHYLGRGTRLLNDPKKDKEAEEKFALALSHDAERESEVAKAWAGAYRRRGNDFLRQGKDSEAEAQFALALARVPELAGEIDKDWANSFFHRGNELLNTGKDAEAQTEFTKALERDPNESAAVQRAWFNTYYRRGERLLQEGKDKEASAVFENALHHAPEKESRDRIDDAWASAYFDRGKAFLRKGNDEHAEKNFTLAVERAHSSDYSRYIAEAWIKAHLERGDTFWKRGQPEAAKAQFALARERMKPFDWRGRYLQQIAAFWLHQSKSALGLTDANEAVSLNPLSVRAREIRIEIHVTMGNVEAAIADLDKLIGDGKGSIEYYYLRGKCHEHQGRTDAAIANFKVALGLAASNEHEKSLHQFARKGLRAFGVEPPVPPMPITR